MDILIRGRGMKIRVLLRFLVFSLFLICINPYQISAQEVEDLLELSLEELLEIEIEVSSFKKETIFNTPSTVTVIDREMIKKYNFSSVPEALNLVAGFSVTRTYLKRDLPTARGILQDHYANKVLVMINGIPTWHATTGESNLNRVNINDVERIEVLKGPASVLYGTNAYSGAVNLILRRAPEKGEKEAVGSAHFDVGTEHLFGGGGNYCYYKKDSFSIALYGNSSYEKGHDYVFTDEEDISGHIREYVRGSNFTLDARYKNHALLFNGFDLHESYLGVIPRFGSEPTATGGAGNDHSSNGYLLHYAFSNSFGEKWNIKLGIMYDWNQRDLSRTLDDNMRSNIEGHRIFGCLGSDISLNDRLDLNLGAEYEYRESLEYQNYNVMEDSLWDHDIAHHNNLKNRSVYESSVFGQLKYKRNLFSLLIGTRYTYNERFGDNLSSRGTFVFNINEKNSIKLIVGQSYRAPSLFELYFRTPQNTVFGSKDLNPEKSTSFEIAYLASFNRFFAQVLGYYAMYDNKIHRVKKDITVDGVLLEDVNVYANGEQFEAIGGEFEIKYQNPKLVNAFLNYGFIFGNDGDEVDDSGHYNFKYVPVHTICAGVVKEFKDFFASSVINYQSDMDGPDEEISDQYTLDLNFGFSHKVSSFYVLHTLSAKNLLDETILVPEYVRVREINHIPLGYGRRIFYTVRVTF